MTAITVYTAGTTVGGAPVSFLSGITGVGTVTPAGVQIDSSLLAQLEAAAAAARVNIGVGTPPGPPVYPAAGYVDTADGSGGRSFQPPTGGGSVTVTSPDGSLVVGGTPSAPQLTVKPGAYPPPQALAKPADKTLVTQGLYARVKPAGQGGSGFLPMCVDPNHTGAHATGRLWGPGLQFGNQWGWSDDDGATYNSSGQNISTRGLTTVGALITSGVSGGDFMFIWTGLAPGSQTGEIFQCAAPDVNGLPGGVAWGNFVNGNGTDLAMTSGANTFTSASLAATGTNNLGRTVTIFGAGAAGGNLTTTVTGQSGSTFTVQDPAQTTVAAGQALIYTALRKIFDLANAAAGIGGAIGTAGDTNSTLFPTGVCVDPTGAHLFVTEYGSGNSVATPAVTWTDGQMAQFSDVVSSAAGTAGNSMIGETVTITGAGASGATLTGTVTKIVQQANPAKIQVSAVAQTAVGAATVTHGTDALFHGIIPGGPSVFHCANPTAAAPTFTKVKQFPGAKHAHTIKIINGLPWVALGDYGAQFSDTGIWAATQLANPTLWSKITLPGPGLGASLDPINMVPATIAGHPVVVCDSDNAYLSGPLIYPGQDGAVRALDQMCSMPAPFTQTMRGIAQTPAGNWMWAGVSEAGAVGMTDCVWMASPQSPVPILLEDCNSTTVLGGQQIGAPISSNGFIWFGSWRCTAEKLVGQT